MAYYFGEPKEIDRFDNEEIILRVFAFRDKLDNYTGNLARFLNHFMSENRELSEIKHDEYQRSISTVLSVINTKADNDSKRRISEYGKTLKEGLLVGLIKNIDNITTTSPEHFNEMLNSFHNTPEFNEENIREGLSAKDKVQSRLSKAISIFQA